MAKSSSELLPRKLNEENSPRFIKRLKNIWAFTKQLVGGFEELSRNMIEHSSYNNGVLSGRIHSDKFEEVYDQRKPETARVFEHFFDFVKPEEKQLSLFDINIIDIGNSGVIETLTKESKINAEIYSDLKEMFLEDVKLSLIHI